MNRDRSSSFDWDGHQESNYFDRTATTTSRSPSDGDDESLEEVSNTSSNGMDDDAHAPHLKEALTPWGGAPIADGMAEIHFKKLKPLGSGAFGTVFQALNVATGGFIAVKEMRITDGVSTNTLKGVQREIRVMCNLPNHLNCVKILGSQQHDSSFYILMEYVSGGSIASLRKSLGSRFHEATMRQYAYTTLKGLHHLHQNNIVHQDIKGANVLIDEKGIIKIADFGCSRELEGVTETLSTAGTPLWMAPEVCRGERATMKSDIWSFGCLLLEMSSEEGKPWSFSNAASPFAVLYAIGNATTSPTIPSHLSVNAKDFLLKCLDVDPAKRPGTGKLLKHPFFTNTEKPEGLEELSSHCTFPAGVISTIPTTTAQPTVLQQQQRQPDDFSKQREVKHSLATTEYPTQMKQSATFRLQAVAYDDDDDDEFERSAPPAAPPRTTNPIEETYGPPIQERMVADRASEQQDAPYNSQMLIWDTKGSGSVAPPKRTPLLKE